VTPGSRAHMIHGQPARAEVKLPPVAAAEKALADHEATCPGSHLECYGKPAREKARLRWIAQKDHLKAMLAMAREAERSGWKDAKGRKVKNPITWSKEAPAPKTASDKAREMREYRARKAEGKAKPNGRPRAEGPPSKAAIRLREARAKKKEAG